MDFPTMELYSDKPQGYACGFYHSSGS